MENIESWYPLWAGLGWAGLMAEAVLRSVFLQSRTRVQATARDGTVAQMEK
jgi:hypothetical protein